MCVCVCVCVCARVRACVRVSLSVSNEIVRIKVDELLFRLFFNLVKTMISSSSLRIKETVLKKSKLTDWVNVIL